MKCDSEVYCDFLYFIVELRFQTADDAEQQPFISTEYLLCNIQKTWITLRLQVQQERIATDPLDRK